MCDLQKVQYPCLMKSWNYPVKDVDFFFFCGQDIPVVYAIETAAHILLSTCNMADIVIKASSALISFNSQSSITAWTQT